MKIREAQICFHDKLERKKPFSLKNTYNPLLKTEELLLNHSCAHDSSGTWSLFSNHLNNKYPACRSHFGQITSSNSSVKRQQSHIVTAGVGGETLQ